MANVLEVLENKALANVPQKPLSQPLSIPHVLSSFDLNVRSDELARFSEALDVNSIEASWRLKRPTEISLLPVESDQSIDLLHLEEGKDPRVIVTISTGRCLAPIGKLTDSLPFNIREIDGYSGFAPAADFDIDKWCAPMEDAVRRALEEGAHLISFGEFDFPPSAVDGHSPEQSIAYAKRRQLFIDRLYEMLDAQNRPVVMFAGSCHDWTEKRCRNLGYILSSKPRGDLEKKGPIVHEKQVSAKKMGEKLKQVEKASLPIYRTKLGERAKIGRLGILICIDAYDTTVTDAIFAQSSLSDEARLGIILVPSYNPNARLYWSCQALSYRANCFVIYVNSLATKGWSDVDPEDKHSEDGNAEPWHRSSEIFASGIPLTTWKSQISSFEQLKASNPRALANLNLMGLQSPEEFKSLIESVIGLNYQPIPEKSFTLHKWTIPNSCFPKLLQVSESRQTEALRTTRRHVVTRGRFKKEAGGASSSSQGGQ